MRIHIPVKNLMKRAPRAFTLVELMVAMAVTSIIVTLLISITSMSMNTWNRSQAEVRAARQAQAMTEIMARDFEAMVVRAGNEFEWLQARSGGSSIGPTGNLSPNSAEIIFFTAATDRYEGGIGTADDLGGDISAVRYSLDFNDPINPSATNSPFSTFVLSRRLINPRETFDNLLGRDNLEPAFNSLPAPTTEEAQAFFVCENIYQFSLTIHLDNEGTNTTVTLLQDSGSLIRVFGDRIDLTPADPSISAGSRITAVEVSITVLSDNAINALRGAASVSPAFIAENSFQYSKLIEVPRP